MKTTKQVVLIVIGFLLSTFEYKTKQTDGGLEESILHFFRF